VRRTFRPIVIAATSPDTRQSFPRNGHVHAQQQRQNERASLVDQHPRFLPCEKRAGNAANAAQATIAKPARYSASGLWEKSRNESARCSALSARNP
jgi:hypothetical protein